MKIKTFYFKRNYQESEKQAIQWEIIFANHVSDKGLVSRAYQRIYGSAIKRQLSFKMSKGFK